MNDPMLQKLHAKRALLLAESGGTLAGLVARIQREQSESGRELRATIKQTNDRTETHDRPQSV
jgi:hypothetical protein